MALIDNLIAYYSFEEASGDAIDDQGANDLPNTGGAINSTTGKIGAARNIEALEFFSLADNADMSVGDIDFSWAGWIWFDDTGVDSFFLNKWESGSHEYAFERFTDNNIYFGVAGNGSTDVYVHNTTTISSGTWYFVAAGHNATTNEIWISVTSEAGGSVQTPITLSHSAGAFAGTSLLCVGTLAAGAFGPTDGRVDEWGFWKRDIRSDLASLYNAGAGRSYAAIVAASAAVNDAKIVIRKA